ncbi:Glutamate racemase OS=Streptomyces glaucescens OX=1907 GN=SGLAU_03685 PE=4 SV=1 [Streptomyces glaucescens]
MDSGIGLLAATAAVRRLRPDADLVLSLDPDGMPWGPRTPEDLTERAVAVAEAAAAHRPDALIVGCNTATVHALPTLRARLEPGIPVIGTVPAIKPAAAGGGPVAIWATPATTGSAYQRGLIQDHAAGVPVTEVPCWGLAEAVEHADETAIDAAVAAAAELTPAEVMTVVLGLHPLRTRRRAHPRRRAAPRPSAAGPARLGRRRRRAGAAPDRGPPGPGDGRSRRCDGPAERTPGPAARTRAVLRRGTPARPGRAGPVADAR